MQQFVELRSEQCSDTLPILREIVRRRDASAPAPTIHAATKPATAASAAQAAEPTAHATITPTTWLPTGNAVGHASEATATPGIAAATALLRAAGSRGRDMRVRWLRTRANA